MSRNLKYQFKNAIDVNFKENMDKHSIKHIEGIGNGKIFSYSDRKNLIDFSANLSNYLKINYPEIKMINDIKTEHIQAFFNEKSEKCSYFTMKQYKAKLNKLEVLVNKTYNIKVNLSSGYILPIADKNTSKIRNIDMKKEEYEKLLIAIQNSKSPAKTGIQLSAKFGLRVCEIVKLQGRDLDIRNGILKIVDSKGGRDRNIDLTEEEIEFCKKVKSCVGENERIVPLRQDSVNKFLSRKLGECGLKEKFASAKTGIHSIRKMAAQNYYNRCREAGYSIEESLSLTSLYLGHGKNRAELMKEYILSIK